MTKPGDSQTKKTIHELVKEFPDKSYRQLEKYRSDTDELERIKGEIQKRKQAELEPIHREIRWREKYKKEQTRSSYLQDELDRVKRENNDLHNKVAALLDEVRPDELSRIKKENNDLHKKVAALLEAVDPAHKIQKARESGL